MIANTNNGFIVDAINNLQVIMVANNDVLYEKQAPLYPIYIPTNKILSVFDDLIVVDNTDRQLYGVAPYLSFVPFQVTYFDGFMLYVFLPSYTFYRRNEDILDVMAKCFNPMDRVNQMEVENSLGFDPYKAANLKLFNAILMAIQEKIRLDGPGNIPDVFKVLTKADYYNNPTPHLPVAKAKMGCLEKEQGEPILTPIPKNESQSIGLVYDPNIRGLKFTSI